MSHDSEECLCCLHCCDLAVSDEPDLSEWSSASLPLHASKESRRAQRPSCDPALLHAPRSVPSWGAAVKPLRWLDPPPLRLARNLSHGPEGLRKEMQANYGAWIKKQFAKKRLEVRFEDVDIGSEAASRFMYRCAALAEKGIYPRLCFHLPSDPLPHAQQPAGSSPEGFYTHETWTTPEPTSLTCRISPAKFDPLTPILACALLDDAAHPQPVPKRKPLGERGTREGKPGGERERPPQHHRSTRRAAPPTPPSLIPLKQNVAHRCSSVVVYNEAHLCPLFTLHYEWLPNLPHPLPRAPRRAPVRPAPLPGANPNKADPDHATTTLALAAGSAVEWKYSEGLTQRVCRRAARRSRDLHLRGQHDKRANLSAGEP